MLLASRLLLVLSAIILTLLTVDSFMNGRFISGIALLSSVILFAISTLASGKHSHR